MKIIGGTPVKRLLKNTPVIKEWLYVIRIWKKYSRVNPEVNLLVFVQKHFNDFMYVPLCKSKAKQYEIILEKSIIRPLDGNKFFYSLDCYKSMQMRKPVFDNYTVDNQILVKSSFAEIGRHFLQEGGKFSAEEKIIINSLKNYINRCYSSADIADIYCDQLNAISSLLRRPANTLFEGLQRILFVNQFLWQTGHILNGLGRLDKILGDLYIHDIKSGVLNRDGAKELLIDFFKALHEYYWFKSNTLMGDTGQIIIIGGKESDGTYFFNELTYLFIEVSMELRFPDPKLLLRCALNMPDDLLELALTCISSGIGIPLLSNDDMVIPAMISCGFEEKDAYEYCTAACWEPLVPGISCDANNIASLNFAEPLVKLFESSNFEKADSVEEIIVLYLRELKEYIYDILTPLTKLEFEEDPLLSLVSESSLERQIDITRGGAKYNNLGLTSVGLGTVVNSFLNIQRLVFDQNLYSISELNALRRNNFKDHENLVAELKDLSPAYGSDDEKVVNLTNRIILVASAEFSKYHTKREGCFKIGLSSPSYISGAKNVPATLDGRRKGDHFGVHISSSKAIPTTELLSFAMKLDYNNNRLNGNVIDFFVTPSFIKQNINKFVIMLRAGFEGGIFQLQMNVVDSKTLIAAKENPRLFSNLVVRVWGFSAYFNDLPEEYKDVLIARAIESEMAS